MSNNPASLFAERKSIYTITTAADVYRHYKIGDSRVETDWDDFERDIAIAVAAEDNQGVVRRTPDCICDTPFIGNQVMSVVYQDEPHTCCPRCGRILTADHEAYDERVRQRALDAEIAHNRLRYGGRYKPGF